VVADNEHFYVADSQRIEKRVKDGIFLKRDCALGWRTQLRMQVLRSAGIAVLSTPAVACAADEDYCDQQKSEISFHGFSLFIVSRSRRSAR
jgi:hypothetical protein